MSDETQETPVVNATKEKPTMKLLETGEQTRITPKVREIADSINGNGVVAAMNIAEHIKSMGAVEGSEGPDFTRTADEVLEDKKYNGCNEAGIVFAALLRAKGTPTNYIQALRRDAVEKYSDKNPSLNGHVFLEADFGDKDTENKIIINSTTGEITATLPEDMIIGRKGLDAWDIGLREGFNDLRELFEEKHQELPQSDEKV